MFAQSATLRFDWIEFCRVHIQFNEVFAAMATLTPFEVGQIKAHARHGLGPAAIAELVFKADGSDINQQTIANAIAKLEADKTWRGGVAKKGAARERKPRRSWTSRSSPRWRRTGARPRLQCPASKENTLL
jgi:hypothetical protein